MRRVGFTCRYCATLVVLPPVEWVRAYATVVEHVYRCTARAAGDESATREYVSSVMARWPEEGEVAEGADER